ncbi:MAG: hypothetical protein JWP94_513 [Mucilaginibacter sp.]|nr:hypothetical protein [Mucilaginibacter sp.]
MISVPVKYTFSGHESFHCREMWLKKAYDHLKAGRSFNDPDAVVSLGVGKNMVTSMKFWLRAFDLLDENDRPNAFADFLFRPVRGFDPFLEDDQSLWLLHYQLVKRGFSSIYKLIFNEFRKEKIQFTKEQFQAFALRKIDNANLKTVADDFDVFKKMYLSKSEDSKMAEDSFLGLLAELQLLRLQQKGIYYIEQTERPTLSAKVLLYTILDNENFGYSVSLQALENDEDSPGTIFALNRQNLLDKIDELAATYDWINYSDHAGVRELQFKLKPANPLSIFN